MVRAGGFDPKIVGFLCNWCSYAGADLAGVSRFRYPPNLKIIRVMCSGSVDPVIVLTILKEGADGVLLGGCHIGDCHYMSGNCHAEKRAIMIRALLERAGLEKERFRLEWISASEGQKFAQVVSEFTETVRNLGPSRVKEDPELARGLEAAIDTALDFRVRSLLAKELELVEKGNIYGEEKTEEELRTIIDVAVEDEFLRNLILGIASDKPSSVKELSRMVSLPTDQVVDHIATLRQKNLLAIDHVEKMTPYYVTLRMGEQ